MIPHLERSGSGPVLLLLHATLSDSSQLAPLAARLAGHYTVVRVDRRGSGRSVVGGPAEPIDVAVHVADLAAIIEREQLGLAAVVGHSYGGCLALELAARQPALVRSVFAYEPPYRPLAPPAVREHMLEVARRTLEARDRGDLAAAGLTFMEGVSGPAVAAALSPGARVRIGQAGRAAVADATLSGMEPDGLGRIACPVHIASGTASASSYADIADALAARVDGAVHLRLDGLDHMAPVTRPASIAAAIEEVVDR